MSVFIRTIIFSDEVVNMKFLLLKFLLLSLDRYLFNVAIANRYQPRGSKESVLSITITENITMSR